MIKHAVELSDDDNSFSVEKVEGDWLYIWRWKDDKESHIEGWIK